MWLKKVAETALVACTLRRSRPFSETSLVSMCALDEDIADLKAMP